MPNRSGEVQHPPNSYNPRIFPEFPGVFCRGAVRYIIVRRMDMELNHSMEHPRPSEIKDALRRILHSAPFQGSKQSQTLLEYLVEHSLKGHEDELKERIIGVEVFGRKSDYDTTVDAIVRARAGEVRKRLAQYYTSDEGQDSTVRILITPGSYRPSFVHHHGTNGGSRESLVVVPPHAPAFHDAGKDPGLEVAASAPRLSSVPHWRVWGIVALATCAVLLAAWATTSNWRKSEFDLFWAPILDSKKPVIIYTGTIPAYLYSTNAASRIVSQHAGGPEEPAEMISLAPLAEGQVLTSRDVVVVPDLASSEDITADVMVAQTLGAHRRSVEFHAGPDLSFVGERSSPMVLVGAMSNQLTLYISRDLPYYFDHDWKIRERGGQGRTWYTSGVMTHVPDVNSPAGQPAGPPRRTGPVKPTASVQTVNQNGSAVLEPDSTLTEDYAIVSRLLDSKTGGPVIVIAGIQSCGNQAAAEFLTDPVQMGKLSGVPRDALEHKNLEFVLHTNLLNGSPASVEIVAERSW